MRSVVVLCVLAVACGDDSGVSDGSTDASVDAPDADRELCIEDTDCDDGLFCTGAERCEPASSEADARGCIVPGDPCITGQTCDESAARCVSDCGITGDADGDGVLSVDCGGSDCDDTDARRYPGNTEVCDTEDLDEDCDPATFGVRDGDGDGEADARCCNSDGAGGFNCGADCDDARAGVNTTAPEVCNGLDEDCDSSVDEGVLVTLYYDGDDDLHGDPDMTMLACPGTLMDYVDVGDDCDDLRSDIHPGLTDLCDTEMTDRDCSGSYDAICSCTEGETTTCLEPGVCASGTRSCDLDGTFGACSNPPGVESCNGLDDDCDGNTDETLRLGCWIDSDLDGYAAGGATMSMECRTPLGGCPTGFTNIAPVGSDIDCNDTTGSGSSQSPALTETCNYEDTDCDGMVDETFTVTCYRDMDMDTYAADMTPSSQECPDFTRGFVGNCPSGFTNRPPMNMLTIDCNDSPAGGSTVNPAAAEQCDGIDNDCNGMIDDGATVLCWADPDDDGFAVVGAMTDMPCRDPSRALRGGCPVNWTGLDPAGAPDQEDCGEGDASTFPGATELCGGGDNDCDGTTADEMTVVCYVDGDDDTYSATSISEDICPVGGRAHVAGCPANYTNRRGTGVDVDCQDTDPNIHPGVIEMCDEPTFVDSNCNPSDEGDVQCWADADDDGWAPSGATQIRSCIETSRMGEPHLGCPVGFTGREPTGDSTTDCNDSDMANHIIVRCYTDSDGDTYRGGGSQTIECFGGSGFGGCPSGKTTRSSPTDCCDSDSSARPGQTAWFTSARNCGGYDYDCNGSSTRRYTATTNADCFAQSSSSACSAENSSSSDGYSSSAPACGGSGIWVSGCSWEQLDPGPPPINFCEQQSFTRPQQCH